MAGALKEVCKVDHREVCSRYKPIAVPPAFWYASTDVKSFVTFA